MKILIVSDSHGRNTYLDKVINQVSPFDMLIHLGDLEGSEHYLEGVVPGKVEMVSGNNDYFTCVAREKIISIGKYKVLLTHGHRYKVNYDLETLKEVARQNGVDIVMFGHTHKPVIDTSNGVIAINPGSISQPRQDGRIPTYIVMDLDRMGEAHFTLNYVR